MDYMGIMNAKQFLKQYENAVNAAERLRLHYREELEKIDTIGSTLSGDGQPHGSGISRKTEDKAIKLAEAQSKWKEAEIDALTIKDEVFSVIWDIPGIEGKVLFERYINLLTWEQIAEKLDYSYSGIFYAHGRALDIVEKRLPEIDHE